MSGAERVVLVTGASRGIGAAVAESLAGPGVRLVLAARTQGGLEETDDAVRARGGEATLLPIDLTTEQADQIGPSIYGRFGRLDGVVHAAGALGKLTPASHIQPRDWAAALATNATAAWRIIRTTAPLLAAGPAGRAVFVTDGLVGAPAAYWGLYGAGKAAMQHLVLSWAAETVRTPVRVNLFDPGPVATRLRREAMPGEDQSRLPKPAEIAPLLVALLDPALTRHGEIVRPERAAA